MVSLKASAIRSSLNESILRKIYSLDVVDCVSSTNDYLLERFKLSGNGVQVCISKQQTAGRGRNGRQWYSPDSHNIYMSVGYRLKSTGPEKASCLSVAIGATIVSFLRGIGVRADLKWPNDVLVSGAKLAGILIENRVSQQEVYTVIGLGLNVKMPDQAKNEIDQQWTDLMSLFSNGESLPDVNVLVASLIEAIITACERYEVDGIAAFLENWTQFDLLTGRTVEISMAQKVFTARVVGLAEDCGLIIDVNGELETVYAGDVKLKL